MHRDCVRSLPGGQAVLAPNPTVHHDEFTGIAGVENAEVDEAGAVPDDRQHLVGEEAYDLIVAVRWKREVQYGGVHE